MRVHRHPYANERHIESGTVAVTTSGVNGSGTASVSFTDAFASDPVVVAVNDRSGTPNAFAYISGLSTSSVTVGLQNTNGVGPTTGAVAWIAEGQD